VGRIESAEGKFPDSDESDLEINKQIVQTSIIMEYS
jgi:hypothetical protein